MKKYLVIYHAPAEVMGKMATATAAEKSEVMELWMAWKAKHDDHVVDFGAPLMGGECVDASGKWDASNKEVSGYSIIQGNSEEEVKGLFNGHPHLAVPGCTVGVHEYIAM